MTSPLQLNPDGTIDLTYESTTIHLSRPKLYQFRELSESLTRHRQKMVDAINAARERPDPEDTSFVTVTHREMLDWLNEVIATLASESAQIGERDAEVWMGMPAASNEMIAHWQSRPSLPGGA